MTPDQDPADDDTIDLQRLNHPALVPALRLMSNLLRLPHMCARATCHRAQWCRGDPRICLARYAPLVPQDAREGAKAMVDGQSRGLDFDAAREEFAEIDDLLAWHALVKSCAARGR
jgi:hypothetical protein